MTFTATQAHDALAGTTNADYVINLNLPAFGKQQAIATPQPMFSTEQKNYLILGSILLILVLGIVFVSRKKSK